MEMKKLIISRFSVRSLTNQPIERQILIEIPDAARFAPSAVNFQPWHFIVISDPEKLKAFHDVYPGNWLKEAPVCIVVCADHQQSWKRRSDGKDFADVDVAIVTDHLVLKATEMGLGTCCACNFDVNLTRKILQIPENIEPLVIVPLGYSNAQPPQKIRKTPAETVH